LSDTVFEKCIIEGVKVAQPVIVTSIQNDKRNRRGLYSLADIVSICDISGISEIKKI